MVKLYEFAKKKKTSDWEVLITIFPGYILLHYVQKKENI